MSDEQQRQRRVEEVIESGRALVRDARYMLERTRRQFAELGINPEAEHEKLKAEGGDEAVARAGAEFQSLLDEVEAEVRRNQMHSQARGGGGRHVRLRPGRV